MRVISGSAKGTKLITIDEMTTRPTLDRVKESLFNIIRNKIDEDCIALDLFAGSGAIGIEILSRGAKEVIFSDLSKSAVNIIKTNLEKTHLTAKAKIINQDYKQTLEMLKKEDRMFDIIFLDPPYKQDIAANSVKLIDEYNLLNKNGIIIIETDESIRETKEIEKLNIKYKIQDMRKYGRATLIFLSWKE